jgi:hypothetical protein
VSLRVGVDHQGPFETGVLAKLYDIDERRIDETVEEINEEYPSVAEHHIGKREIAVAVPYRDLGVRNVHP